MSTNTMNHKYPAVEMAPALPGRSSEAQESLNRGLALHAQGRPHEALGEYQRALEMNGEDAYGRYLAGLALKAIGRDSDAVAEWQRARDMRELDEDSAWGLAMARRLLDSYI